MGIQGEIGTEAVASAIGVGGSSVSGQGVPPGEGVATLSKAISGEGCCGIGALSCGGSTIRGISEEGHGVDWRRDQSPLGIQGEIGCEVVAGAVCVRGSASIGQGVPSGECRASLSKAISCESC